MLGCAAMPANQSLPWGGVKLRARSSSEGPPATDAAVPFRIEDKRPKNEQFPHESDQNLSLPQRLEGFQNQNQVPSEMLENGSSSSITMAATLMQNDKPECNSVHRTLRNHPRAESVTGRTAEEHGDRNTVRSFRRHSCWRRFCREHPDVLSSTILHLPVQVVTVYERWTE